MLKILFVSHDSTLFGAQICLAELLRGIDRNRFDPFLVAPYEGPLNDLVRALGIPVTIREIKPWLLSRAARDRSRTPILCSTLHRLHPPPCAIPTQTHHHH